MSFEFALDDEGSAEEPSYEFRKDKTLLDNSRLRKEKPLRNQTQEVEASNDEMSADEGAQQGEEASVEEEEEEEEEKAEEEEEAEAEAEEDGSISGVAMESYEVEEGRSEEEEEAEEESHSDEAPSHASDEAPKKDSREIILVDEPDQLNDIDEPDQLNSIDEPSPSQQKTLQESLSIIDLTTPPIPTQQVSKKRKELTLPDKSETESETPSPKAKRRKLTDSSSSHYRDR